MTDVVMTDVVMDGTTIRNLDIATLRSFVTVAELGGVTRAAARSRAGRRRSAAIAGFRHIPLCP